MILENPDIREESLHPFVAETRRRLLPSPSRSLCLDAIIVATGGDDPDELFEAVVSVCLAPERATGEVLEGVNRITGPTPLETRRGYGVAILTALLATAEDADLG